MPCFILNYCRKVGLSLTHELDDCYRFPYVIVHSLICHCKQFINVELPSLPPGCYPNGTCATDTGQCFVELKIAELGGHKRYTYNCIEDNPDDQVYRVHATCILNVPSATQVVLCCNNTDYCNENLNPDDRLLTDPSMSLTPSPQLTDESPTNEEQMQRTIGKRTGEFRHIV